MTTKYRVHWRHTGTDVTGQETRLFDIHRLAQRKADTLNNWDDNFAHWVEPVEVKEEQYTLEKRQCGVCGETWIDTGEPDCPFCGSAETNPVEED